MKTKRVSEAKHVGKGKQASEENGREKTKKREKTIPLSEDSRGERRPSGHPGAKLDKVRHVLAD